MLFILSQLFGIISLIIFCLGIQVKNKDGVLKVQALVNLFITIQYLLLTAYTGAFMFCINATRSFSFYKYEKIHKKQNIYLLIIFILFSIILGAISYKNIYSFLPVIASIIATYTLWQKKVFISRLGIIISSIILIGYSLKVEAYSVIVTYLVVIISTFISIVRNDIKFNKLQMEVIKNG